MRLDNALAEVTKPDVHGRRSIRGGGTFARRTPRPGRRIAQQEERASIERDSALWSYPWSVIGPAGGEDGAPRRPGPAGR